MKVKAIEQPGQRKYDWVLIDEDTGKLLDDNQGLGYKTGVGAHKCWGYNHRSASAVQKEKKAAIWWQHHPIVKQNLDNAYLEYRKMGGSFNLVYAKFKQLILKSNLELNETNALELWRVYQKQRKAQQEIGGPPHLIY